MKPSGLVVPWRQGDGQAELLRASWGYKICPEDKMEQSECVRGNVCVHVHMCEAFIVVTLEIVARPGSKLVCIDVGLWGMDRGGVCVRETERREGKKVKALQKKLTELE